jgi:EpsI family protein
MNKRNPLAFIGTAGLLLGALVLSGLSTRRVPEPLARPLTEINSRISGWRAVGDHQLDPGTLRTLNSSAYLSRFYQKGTFQLELFVAFYALQHAGESMHSPRHCLPGGGWEIWKRDLVTISSEGKTVEVNRFSIANLNVRMLMFYWYQSHDRVFASEYTGKFLLAHDTILNGHTSGSIVRIMLPDVPGADKEGKAFCAELIPQVKRCLGGQGITGSAQ